MSADFVPIPGKVPALGRYRLSDAPGQPYGAHRLLRRAAVRPGHATDRHGITCPAFALRAPHHRLDHLAADRADGSEQRLRHPQLLGLLPIGIGHITRLEPGRTPRNAGNGLGNPATGAGLGGGDVGIQNLQAPAKFSGKLGDFIHGPLLIGLAEVLPYTSDTRLQGTQRIKMFSGSTP
ncbi:hypothetical protein EMIT048CA2_110048 [Pseudomonas chlororaphis]